MDVVVLAGAEAWLVVNTLLAVAVGGLILFLILRKLIAQPSNSLQLPPGRVGLPILGETLDYLRCLRENKANDFVEERKLKYGGTEVFRTSLFFHQTVVLGGPEASRFLYSSEGKLVRESWPRSAVVKLLGDNTLVALSAQPHRRLRRLVMTCLYPEALQKFVLKVDLLTQQHLAQHWHPVAAQSPPNNTLVLYNLIKSHALNVATVLLLGVGDDQLASLFITLISGLLSLPIYLPGTRYYKAHCARAKLIKLLSELICERKREIEASQRQSGEFKDLVSTLITAKDEDGNPLTQSEILDTIITLLFAGHDTNSSTITLACKFLSANPDCYEHVVKEQTAIAESKLHDGEALSWHDVLKMKYTWSVVQETLRLQPVVTWSFKEALQDFEYRGFTIPRGWKMMHHLARCNMDEECFPDPQQFNPSRFMQVSQVPNTFLPFGGGAHICPGIDFARMTILVFFHHLVRRFKWSLVDPCEHVSIDPMPVPVNGLPISVEPRMK